MPKTHERNHAAKNNSPVVARKSRPAKSDIAKADSRPTVAPRKPSKLIPEVLRRKRHKTRYEMILVNRSDKSPYITQKLIFLGPSNIYRAWEEARKLRDLLVRAGDFHKRDYQIVAFGLEGGTAAFMQEYHIKLGHDQATLDRAVRKIIRRK